MRISKWAATIAVAWQKLAAYRLNFLLMVLAPSLVFFFVKVSLWSSIYQAQEGLEIGGYDRAEMLAYQCYVLGVGLLTQSNSTVALAQDIRLGRITAHLLHPFGFLEFHTAHWLADRGLQVLVVGLLFGLVTATGWLPFPGLSTWLRASGVIALAALLWFQIHLGLSLCSFWLEETWVLRVIFAELSVFLSGAILPLELYPSWLVATLKWTPFPALTWMPARILMGELTDPTRALQTLLVWNLLAFLLVRWVWSRGLKLYAAAGM